MKVFSNIVSIMFHPLLMVTYGILLALTYTYLAIYPVTVRLAIVGGTFITTAVIPGLFILLLIKNGAARLGLKSVRTRLMDASVYNENDNKNWDTVMLDVPCSGLGMIRKKPEIRYGFNSQNVSKLQGLQRRMLNACSRYVKPGGALVYSTCTLTPEENEKNTAWAVKTIGLKLDFEELILPDEHNADGFYIAKFTV